MILRVITVYLSVHFHQLYHACVCVVERGIYIPSYLKLRIPKMRWILYIDGYSYTVLGIYEDTSQHARARACTHTRTHARTHARMHARTYARMHARTHHARTMRKTAWYTSDNINAGDNWKKCIDYLDISRNRTVTNLLSLWFAGQIYFMI